MGSHCESKSEDCTCSTLHSSRNNVCVSSGTASWVVRWDLSVDWIVIWGAVAVPRHTLIRACAYVSGGDGDICGAPLAGLPVD